MKDRLDVCKFIGKINYQEVECHDIKINGLQVINDRNKIEIYNDPFRTVPLFIAKDKNNEIILFSNFEEFYLYSNFDKTIDKVGFWEIVLFGSGLWSRTLYKCVEQMPSASKIVIDKNTNEYTIERYWDFDIVEDNNIDSIEKAAQGLYDRLDRIFSKLDKNQKYVMGMSGGMDSRITLAFLSKYILKENLELFTYGFDERLLEYKYACEVAEALGYNKPKFHKLTKKSYKDAMNYLPQMSGGQIGINHCHITSFLKENKLEGYKQISNYFSDALFGYDCTNPKKIENIDVNYYSKHIENIDFLSLETKNKILEDAKNIFKGFTDKSNFSSLSEYRYLTERNQKFHSYLAYIQKGNLILADFDLLIYMTSISIEHKEQKKLIDFILNKYFPKVSNEKFENISSRDFNGVNKGFTISNKLVGAIKWYNFKFLNRANAILRPFTKGHIQLFNKYQTEEQERLLYRNFDSFLYLATQKFVDKGLMTIEQKKYWDKLPLRANGVGERYYLIGLARLIK
ncbi:hypothetical protein KJ839_06795 [Patescibacteria group bacterium]|nr:hypothetical protein [Patescibacteria group bacterium]